MGHVLVHEEILTRIQVWHGQKMVYEKTVDYTAPLEELRKAREEVQQHAYSLKGRTK